MGGGHPAAGGAEKPEPPSEPEPGSASPQTPNIEFKPHPNPAEITGNKIIKKI